MDINYLDKISSQLSQYEDSELISSSYWDIIYGNLYLTHELLKLNKFKLFSEINPSFFEEDIISMDLLGYENPPYHYIPQKTLNSDSFWIHALEYNYTYVSKIPENFLANNESLCFWICEKFSDHAILKYFPDKLKNNFDLVYFAVDNNPQNFQYISNDLKNSSYIYEIIYKKSSRKCKSSDYFKLAGNNIRSNYKFAKKSIIENPSSFFMVDESLKNDSAFFIEMLNYSENILKFANSNIKKNELCVLASIEKNPLTIEYADSYFKSSIEFILAIHDVVQEHSNFTEFAKLLDSNIFSNNSFVEKYFTLIYTNSCYHLLQPNIRNNKDIMYTFIEKDINAFNFVSNTLKSDIGFIKSCYEFHNQKHLLQQFNEDSPQSNIFKMLEDSQLNDIVFLQNLYQEFKPIFKDIVFPILQKKRTILTDLLSNELNIENGLNHLLDKFELKNKLENHLGTHQGKPKNKKI